MVNAAPTLEAVRARVDAAVSEIASIWDDLAGRDADVLGHDDVPRLVARTTGGGKMIRPEMVHWGWVSAGGDAASHAQMIEIGAAVELLHLFALVHDDVMDHADLRRGQPTAHRLAREAHERAGGAGSAQAFGNAVAILVGDLLLAEADRLIAGMPLPLRDAWRTMIFELVLGQRRDLTGAALGRRDLEHAREVARLKSGAYTVAGPLRLGALAAGASPATLACLDAYARHAGEAFGLRDDVLGLWGDPASTGKSVEDDLTDGKATVLLALADARLSPADRALLVRAGSGELSDAQIATLRDAMATCGVRDDVEAMIGVEVDAARACLDPASVTPAGIEGLVDITHRIAWRQK